MSEAWRRATADTAELWVKRAGIRKIHLLVLSENFGVVRFYEKLGYASARSFVAQMVEGSPGEAIEIGYLFRIEF